MTTRNRTFLTLAVVAIACIAMTTPATGVITQTNEGIGYPSALTPIATDDLLETSLTSESATGTSWGNVAALTDGTYVDIGTGDQFGWTGWNYNGDATLTYVLNDHFDIGMIRVTGGYLESNRSDQGWDVYTSENGGTTWDLLRMANTFGHTGGYPATAGTGSTITLTDSTGTLAANVNAIRFDTYVAFTPQNHVFSDTYQEIDIFAAVAAVAAVPEPSTFALAAFGLLGLIGFGRRRKR